MKHFFISYNKADRQWAEWIAWELEAAGIPHTVVADSAAGSLIASGEVEAILGAASIDEQCWIYERSLRDELWTRWIRWAISRDLTLSLLGVPRSQRQQVERDYAGGIARFVEDCVEIVFARLPLSDNYFWRVYLTGEYTPECCPEYLKPANFDRLQRGLADRISTHTCSVTDFLKSSPRAITRFVLLDHMDWLSSTGGGSLEQEWQAIVERAAPRARVIWRSGGLRADFVDQAGVRVAGRPRRMGEILKYDRALADADVAASNCCCGCWACPIGTWRPRQRCAPPR
jgi:S-adenosylmethionine-diacylglycerol 3-amino-3-carboxypropyl transferase